LKSLFLGQAFQKGVTKPFSESRVNWRLMISAVRFESGPFPNASKLSEMAMLRQEGHAARPWCKKRHDVNFRGKHDSSFPKWALKGTTAIHSPKIITRALVLDLS
jgi:hypothetical protein